MKILKIQSSKSGLAAIYLENLDRDKVRSAHEDPRIRQLAERSGFRASSAGGLVLYAQSGHEAYKVSLIVNCIVVNRKYLSIAEEATEIVLGESLDRAVRDFKGLK